MGKWQPRAAAHPDFRDDGTAAVFFDYERAPTRNCSRWVSSGVPPSPRRHPDRRAHTHHELAMQPRSRSSSQLTEITNVATDAAALPILRFEYTAPETRWSASTSRTGRVRPAAEGRAWVDVDGDALPNLLEGQPVPGAIGKNGCQALGPWIDLKK